MLTLACCRRRSSQRSNQPNIRFPKRNTARRGGVRVSAQHLGEKTFLRCGHVYGVARPCSPAVCVWASLWEPCSGWSSTGRLGCCRGCGPEEGQNIAAQPSYFISVSERHPNSTHTHGSRLWPCAARGVTPSSVPNLSPKMRVVAQCSSPPCCSRWPPPSAFCQRRCRLLSRCPPGPPLSRAWGRQVGW